MDSLQENHLSVQSIISICKINWTPKKRCFEKAMPPDVRKYKRVQKVSDSKWPVVSSTFIKLLRRWLNCKHGCRKTTECVCLTPLCNSFVIAIKSILNFL